MPTSLLRWLRARRTRTDLRAVGELPVSRLFLEVEVGDATENPMTGSKAALRPLAAGGGAYRGGTRSEGVTLEFYDPANATLVLHDLVGHPGLKPAE